MKTTPTIYSVLDPSWETNALVCLSGIYLHGKLQDAVGYDICAIGMDPIEVGVYPVKVSGYDKPCTAYIWRLPWLNGIGRGLIVDSNDVEGNKEALKSYKTREELL